MKGNLFMKSILVVLALVSPLAHAEFYSGNELYEKLISANSADRNFAAGYVAGVADAGHGKKHCAPAGITIRQVVDLATDILKSQPQNRQFPADAFISATLAHHWPCKGGSNT